MLRIVHRSIRGGSKELLRSYCRHPGGDRDGLDRLVAVEVEVASRAKIPLSFLESMLLVCWLLSLFYPNALLQQYSYFATLNAYSLLDRYHEHTNTLLFFQLKKKNLPLAPLLTQLLPHVFAALCSKTSQNLFQRISYEPRLKKSLVPVLPPN